MYWFANDGEPRDPSSYELYGTNDSISSLNHSDGNAESWTLIASGPLSLPSARLTAAAAVDVTNTVSYTSYKMVFPTIKNGSGTESLLQFGEIPCHHAARICRCAGCGLHLRTHSAPGGLGQDWCF